jgi:hypothetical protein
MGIMVTELYDAFIASGAPEDKARAAAQTMAAPNDRLERLDTRINSMENRMGNIETKLEMLQWMVGGVGAGVLLLVLRTFWAG